jgi:hypothetical protein
LHQNYPNPFNPTCVVSYGLPHASAVSLTLYNMLGQRVAVLDEGMKQAGWHHVTVTGTGLSSGVYLYRLEAGTFSMTRKMVVLK